MSGTDYINTQLFNPQEKSDVEGINENASKLKSHINLEDLFLPENLYKNVKSEKMEGKAKVTIFEKSTEIPKIIFKERVKKVITREKEIEKIVEVIENKENVIYTEVKVPKYVDVPIVYPRQEMHYRKISKNIPRGVELVVTQPLEVPKIKPKYVEIPVSIYVPCYIEVPIPAQYIPADKNEYKDYFTSGISDNCELPKLPIFYNSLKNSQKNNTPITVNQNLDISDEKALDLSSKCSVQDISDHINFEKTIVSEGL